MTILTISKRMSFGSKHLILLNLILTLKFNHMKKTINQFIFFVFLNKDLDKTDYFHQK